LKMRLPGLKQGCKVLLMQADCRLSCWILILL